MSKIRRDLPNDEYQAAIGANNPSASNPFATISDLTSSDLPHAVAAGTNTYTVTIPGVTAYTDGDAYLIRFTNGSDADSTLDINSLGAVTLVKQPGVQITGGDIIAGQEMLVIYDGTNFQCIIAAPNQLFAYVTNDDSVTINKGEPVYAFGASGNRMSVKLAENTSDATSAQTVGVVYSTSIAPNQRGFVITQGVVSGLNTGMYSAGDQLYLGATAGALTNVKPYAPNHLVYIGIVERANAGNGQIYVKPQNGYELDELHDVDLITNAPTDGQVLTYDNSTGLWKNEDLPAVIGENLNVNLSPVIDNTISDPSTIIDPNYDDSYLIPIGAIGVWAGQDNNIATWDGEQWLFYTPSAGDSTTVLTGPNAGYVYTFDGSVWNITITTSPGATPFYIAGSAVDAGGNKTSTIARVAALTLGSNSGAYGSSPLTVRGTGSLENVVTRWGMGAGNVTGLNNWYRIATFLVNYGTSKNYQILVNIGGKSANTFASVVLHINISKTSPAASTGRAICRVVNVSGPGYLSVAGDGNYRLDESNFEFRRYANAGLGPVTFRLYYKPTIVNSFMSATVLNSIGGTTSALGIQWNNTFLGAAIEGPAFGGSTDNYATFNYSGQRTNISAIIDPTVTDDYTLQYTVGSLWYNTVTQKVFQCLDSASGAAVWKQITNETASSGASYLNNVVLVNSVSDLPAPSGGTITLAANTVYEFNTGVFNIGTNYLTISDGTIIEGQSSFNTTLIYTGTGGALRGTDVSFAARQIAFASPAGRVLDFTNVAQTKNISLQNCVISSQTSASIVTGYNIVFMSQTRFVSSVGGLNLVNNLGVALELVVFNTTNSGTYITLTPTATTTAKIQNCDFEINTGNIGINVTTTAIASGIISGCDFKGTATVANRLTGVNGNTAGWNISYGTNSGIAGLQFVDIEIGANVSAALGNGAGTYIDTGVKGYAIPIASYDSFATVMEARITALMTNAIGTAVQVGVYDVTSGAIVGGLGASNVGTNVAVQSNFIAITPNRDYTAYYVKAIGAATRQSIKLTLKIY